MSLSSLCNIISIDYPKIMQRYKKNPEICKLFSDFFELKKADFLYFFSHVTRAWWSLANHALFASSRLLFLGALDRLFYPPFAPMPLFPPLPFLFFILNFCNSVTDVGKKK